MPVWLPMTLGFTASGSLFAWSSWKLAVAVFRPGDHAAAEYAAQATDRCPDRQERGVRTRPGEVRAGLFSVCGRVA
jgi:hypothetical protein